MREPEVGINKSTDSHAFLNIYSLFRGDYGHPTTKCNDTEKSFGFPQSQQKTSKKIRFDRDFIYNHPALHILWQQ